MDKLKPTATLFFDTRRPKKNNTYPVKITIYFNGAKERYNTNVSVTTEQWEKLNAGSLRDDYLKTQKRTLAAIVEKAEKAFAGIEPFSFEAFEAAFFNTKPVKGGLSLEKCFEAYIATLNAQGRVGTASSYSTAKNSILSFKPKLMLPQITPGLLNEYEAHMKANGASASTIGIYMRSLRVMLNKAINDGLMKPETYPFKQYNIPSSRNIKKALSEEELKKVLNHVPELPEQQKALDFWIFTYLCNGINMTDLLMLKHTSVDGDFMHFFRAKTINTKKKDLRPIKVYLARRAKDIMEKWQTDKARCEFLFPMLCPELTPIQQRHRIKSFIKFVNKNMKAIGEELKINKHMGTYTARHTHATMLKRKGVPTSAIGENLGHSSIATTEFYMDSFSDDVKKEYASLLLDL